MIEKIKILYQNTIVKPYNNYKLKKIIKKNIKIIQKRINLSKEKSKILIKINKVQ